MMGRRATTTNYHDVCCRWCRKFLSRKAKSRRDDKQAVVRYERRVEAKADIREQLEYYDPDVDVLYNVGIANWVLF
jgi:hypothetical protein